MVELSFQLPQAQRAKRAEFPDLESPNDDFHIFVTFDWKRAIRSVIIVFKCLSNAVGLV